MYEYRRTESSYCRAMCMLELLMLKRDILFVPDGDFTTSDIDEVIRNVRTFAFLRIFIHHNMVEEKTNIQTYTYSNFYF